MLVLNVSLRGRNIEVLGSFHINKPAIINMTACIFIFYITLPLELVNIVSVSTETGNKKTLFEGDFLLTNIFQNALSR